ncbi:ABC transporter permease [Streptococcus sp. H31]|uniref:ABC transporter permease n=1 Tax=Streptococcus huangxiaojuni TaxID=3237239 RepID=UPI0034A45201
MFRVFKDRRRRFLLQLLRYSRYVFNDHFVLVLLVLLGFLLVQYRNLLENFPQQPVFLFAALGAVLLALLNSGSIATYLEPADRQFWLPKESELKMWILQAQKRSFLFGTLLQTLFLLLVTPVFLRQGFFLWHVALLAVLLAVLKWFLIGRKVHLFWNSAGRLDWDAAIDYEKKRQQSLLKFFALFTRVKGLSGSVKRRRYLDGLLKFLKKEPAFLWENLYWRAFLRSSDYASLSLRLLLLSVLGLIFVDHPLVAASLALLFNYLLLFQLLALYYHFDYHYFTGLFPIDRQLKGQNLKRFLSCIAYLLLVIEMPFTLSWQGAGLLAVVTVVTVEIYLPYKIRQMID